MRNRFYIYLFLAFTFHFLFFGSLIFISRFWWSRNFISGGDGKSLFLNLKGERASSSSSNSSVTSTHVSVPHRPMEEIQPKVLDNRGFENQTASKKDDSKNLTENSNKNSKGNDSFSNQGGGSGSPGGSSELSKGSSSLMSEIRNKIERAKRYPALARIKQIEGIVALNFSMDASGKVEKLNISKSSGSTILDEEALAAVKRAAPFPYYPKPLSLSLKFTLREGE